MRPLVAAGRSGLALLVVSSTMCTPDDPRQPPPSPRASVDVVVLRETTYRIVCDPVPEQMLDVKMATARSASGAVWAIASVPVSHGVAVPAMGDCGPFTLALNDRLSEATARDVADEVRALEARFGDGPDPASAMAP
jgi:hypothetical protein